jgi:hypothetical protein
VEQHQQLAVLEGVGVGRVASGLLEQRPRASQPPLDVHRQRITDPRQPLSSFFMILCVEVSGQREVR